MEKENINTPEETPINSTPLTPEEGTLETQSPKDTPEGTPFTKIGQNPKVRFAAKGEYHKKQSLK